MSDAKLLAERGPIRKSYGAHSWALTNYGIVVSVYRTRRECIEDAESISGEPWWKCRNYYEVRKVTLTEGWV